MPGFPQFLGLLLSLQLCFLMCWPLTAQAYSVDQAFWAGAKVAGGSELSEEFSVTPSQAWEQEDATQCPCFLTR